MAVRVAVPLDPPMRRVVCAVVMVWFGVKLRESVVVGRERDVRSWFILVLEHDRYYGVNN